MLFGFATFALVILYLLLGVTHIVTAIAKYFSKNNADQKYRTQFGRYLIGVIAYFLSLLVAWNVFNLEKNMNQYETLLLLYLFVVPWILAVYYWQIRQRIKKSI